MSFKLSSFVYKQNRDYYYSPIEPLNDLMKTHSTMARFLNVREVNFIDKLSLMMLFG